ncbi:MAG: UvrB/UvrC motif-containing protein [Sedimentisphaerales bacterium]|nr:UvrB/UvrC motif-containing protein [Sedimentisphaerales bacterium]
MCSQIATVHLTEIVNGVKKERHLCEKCAQKEGITIKAHVPLSELLDSVVSAQKAAEELSDLTCPECGITWPEFRQAGSLGCPHDYVAFGGPLRKLIETSQEGAMLHVGKVPPQIDRLMDVQGRLLRLKHDLRQALTEEDYETAAKLRDQIGHMADS